MEQLATLPAPSSRKYEPASAVKWLLALSLPLYLLDQVTKYLVWRNITGGEYVPVIPGWFDLVHVGNTGAAWGMLHNQNTFFAVLSCVAIIAVAVLYRYGSFVETLPKIGVFLLLPGILGNLTDRVVHGHVVDFLSFDLHVRYADPWPSFNVADSCICVAVGLFVISSFLDLFRPSKLAT